jgi:hypothetical protein
MEGVKWKEWTSDYMLSLTSLPATANIQHCVAPLQLTTGRNEFLKSTSQSFGDGTSSTGRTPAMPQSDAIGQRIPYVLIGPKDSDTAEYFLVVASSSVVEALRVKLSASSSGHCRLA